MLSSGDSNCTSVDMISLTSIVFNSPELSRSRLELSAARRLLPNPQIPKNCDDDDNRSNEPNDAIHPEALQLYII
jgi:hypothetical protein